MKVSRRSKIASLVKLGEYLQSDCAELRDVIARAYEQNGWFIPLFIHTAIENIAEEYLQRDKLETWLSQYPDMDNAVQKNVGVVMAGNIPAVGFHDLICILLSGNKASIKLSAKDEVLIRHFVKKLISWEPALEADIEFREMLKGCDAYIATGSNNSARYFHYYFGKYAHVIRKNRTSVAILDGEETPAELDKLADDVFLYFGLGCRNVTKLWVPEDYDFTHLLDALGRYRFLKDFHHYNNNFDYNLSILLLNREPYLSNEMVLLVEKESPFSPISVLHYEKYKHTPPLNLVENENIQCVIGHHHLPFGLAQQPALNDYADGIDTMQFLCSL